jgi:hypothetical protein
MKKKKKKKEEEEDEEKSGNSDWLSHPHGLGVAAIHPHWLRVAANHLRPSLSHPKSRAVFIYIYIFGFIICFYLFWF